MALTPVELRHLTPGRGLFGYSRPQTDRLLEDVAVSFEDVWRERADLADKVEQLEADLVRFKELETLLRTTLLSAERASEQLKEQARRETELIVSEAHAEARRVQREAMSENERLVADSRRIRAQLRAALEAIEREHTWPGEDAAKPDEREAA
jgi:cell division initiation protein